MEMKLKLVKFYEGFENTPRYGQVMPGEFTIQCDGAPGMEWLICRVISPNKMISRKAYSSDHRTTKDVSVTFEDAAIVKKVRPRQNKIQKEFEQSFLEAKRRRDQK